MSRSLIKAAAVLAIPALGLFAVAPSADAAIIYGLTENNNIFRVNSNDPTIIETASFVQGLGGAELLGIDFRPANGQLYGITTDNRVLSINPDTGAVLGSTTLTTPLNGTAFGVDFNPVADRLRIVSDTGQNLRVDVTTGATTVDVPVAAGNNLVGAAYTLGGATTTLYTIDSLADTLNIQNPPNNGTQVLVGQLEADGAHIDTTNRVGFDIGPDGAAFAAFNEIGFSLSDLYTINLATGDIEFVNQFGGGFFVRDIAVVIPEPATLGLLSAATLLAARRRRA